MPLLALCDGEGLRMADDSSPAMPAPLPGDPPCSKLLSMMGTGESVAAYCREHLRGTRVVCCGSPRG